MRNFFWKLSGIFIEWRDDDGKMKLSMLSWPQGIYAAFAKIFDPCGDFEYNLVPPWKIRITKS